MRDGIGARKVPYPKVFLKVRRLGMMSKTMERRSAMKTKTR